MDPFEAARPRLMAIAYRMLGSAAEAEDVVQEAWLRWRASSTAEVASPPAFLGTVVTRLCLDELKSAHARRERYVGPWLPEPVRTSEGETDRESISMAFLILLERLSPLERAGYLLHEVFDYSHAEVAEMVGSSEAAARQAFHRARVHVAAEQPRFAPSRAEHELLLGRFLAACAGGDLDALRALLAADAVAWSDGGGKVSAALKVVRGADAVARLTLGLARKLPPDASFEMADFNGWPAVVLRHGAALDSVISIETDGALVFAMHIVRNPDKLTRV